ncbi:hypothetical protein SteCoe_39603 [Stentor coeruleus]|uniref:Uncharacterized protein n=1 Tax=Stentor coeruleus TaxID=5963 RepID=A0A1R2AKT2_9CILI|nr:hypothetical protein SteCoe_39603 [Stentor coeruleus]
MIPIMVGNIAAIYPECVTKIFKDGYKKKFEMNSGCFNQSFLESIHDENFFLLTLMRSLTSLKSIIISKPLCNSTFNNYFIKIISYLHQPLKVDLTNCKIIDSTIINCLKSFTNLKTLKFDFKKPYYSSQDVLSLACQFPASLNLTIPFSLLESILNNEELTKRLEKLIISPEQCDKNYNNWLHKLSVMLMNSEYKLSSLKIQDFMWKRKFFNYETKNIIITKVKLSEADYYLLYKISEMGVFGKIYEINISETGELSRQSESYLVKILKLLFPERLIATNCIGEWSDIYEIKKFTKKFIF